MKQLSLTFILGLLFSDFINAQNKSINSSIITTIDSVRNFKHPYPSRDLLPTEFYSSALENEYYISEAKNSPTYYRNYVFVLNLRDNCTCIHEGFYVPYDWARIEFSIGKFRTSGDTVYITYQPLLKGKRDEIYLSPIVAVSWTIPSRPKYLTIQDGKLFDPTILEKGLFYSLARESRFELNRCK